jgi:hypothetical protein
MIFTFAGCDDSDGKGVEHEYAPTVRWNDTNYIITPNTIVAKEDIGEQISTIKKIVKKFPKENYEANNNIEVGTKLYRIKNEKITESIAVERNGKYLKAVIIELLNK